MFAKELNNRPCSSILKSQQCEMQQTEARCGCNKGGWLWRYNASTPETWGQLDVQTARL